MADAKRASRLGVCACGPPARAQGQLETNAFKLVRAKQQEQEEEHARLLTAADRVRVQVEAKDRHADDVRKDVELASIEADKILADQVELDIKIKVRRQRGRAGLA